jgi:hypothetical protein
MANNVLTGAIALVKVSGTIVGRMKNIRATENISRGDVRGLGTIYTIEAPVVGHAGSLSCSFYEIDFTISPIANAIRRDVQTNQQFQDQLCLLDPQGITLDIFKKVQDVIDADGFVIPKAVPYASITRLLLDSESFDISEGAIANRDQTFRFLDPIKRPK